jgi:branched-subunit amino acid transport protein AzlD
MVLWYINCILVTRHPDNGHGGEWNALVKYDSMWLSIFIIAYLLVYYISKQHSLMHGHGMYKIQNDSFM